MRRREFIRLIGGAAARRHLQQRTKRLHSRWSRQFGSVERLQIVERASGWPEDAQEELIRTMEDIDARYLGVCIATRDDRAALKQSEADIKQNRFASDEDIQKVFHQFHSA